jgi:ribose-phosphate pyrophosphokinase
MIKLNGHIVTPTIFPDKTSQVWKLPDDWFNPVDNTIMWEFENEAEFMHVAQLKELIYSLSGPRCVLELPYLPYARQDKPVTNQSTFAFRTFASLLNALQFREVVVFDPHNLQFSYLIQNVNPIMPNVAPLLEKLHAAPVYPDSGAAKRYKADSTAIHCEKIREPLTGKIEGLTVIGTVEPKAYLIIDDICDGGRTFIEVAKKLYEAGATEVHLYISHGIFSKGLEPLREAGIKRIFTRNGEVIK